MMLDPLETPPMPEVPTPQATPMDSEAAPSGANGGARESTVAVAELETTTPRAHRSVWPTFFFRCFFALLIPAAAVALVTWWMLRDAPQEQLVDRAATLPSSTVAANAINHAVERQLSVLRTLAGQGRVPDEVADKNLLYRGAPEVIREIIAGVDRDWREAFAAGDQPPRPVADTEGSRSLRSFRSMFPANRRLIAVDRYGAATASTEVTPRFDYSNEAWFENVMSSGQMEITSSVEPGGRPYLEVSLPMLGTAGQPAGLLRSVLDSGEVIALAVAEIEQQAIDVVVIGPQGELLYRSVGRAGGAPVESALIDLAERGESTGAIKLTLANGTDVIASAAPLARLPGIDVGAALGWKVLTLREAAALSGFVDAQKRLGGEILLTLALVALALALVLAWWLRAPLRRLRAVRNIVRTGDWSQRLRPRRGETGAIAGSINEILIRTEASEARQQRLDELQRDAAKLESQVDRFVAGERLTLFSTDTEELSSLAGALRTLRDDLGQRLSRLERGLDDARAAASGLLPASWTEDEEAALKRARKAKTELTGLSVELKELSSRESALNNSHDRDLSVLEDAAREQSARVFARAAETQTHQRAANTGLQRLTQLQSDLGTALGRVGELNDRIGVLALNASIQAALAGESGRGFAVIAAEMEQLSRQSTHSLSRVRNVVDLRSGAEEALARDVEELAATVSAVKEIAEVLQGVVVDSERRRVPTKEQSAAIIDTLRSASGRSSGISLELEQQVHQFEEAKQASEAKRRSAAEFDAAVTDLATAIGALRGPSEVGAGGRSGQEGLESRSADRRAENDRLERKHGQSGG